MQPWADHKHDGRFTLIMDNAPSHRSKSTASWFARHWPAGGSRHVIYQPPASPDLNPLDYTCWATWARKVPHCASLAELRAKVIGAGLELNQNPDIGRKAISVEFRRRLAACIAAGGDVFEWTACARVTYTIGSHLALWKIHITHTAERQQNSSRKEATNHQASDFYF